MLVGNDGSCVSPGAQDKGATEMGPTVWARHAGAARPGVCMTREVDDVTVGLMVQQWLGRKRVWTH